MSLLLLVDLDGVVYRGADPVPGVAALLTARVAAGDDVVYVTNNSMHYRADYVTRLTELISSGRRGEAVEYYMTRALRVPVEEVAHMQNAPMWEAMEAVAHTLVYDGTIMGDTMHGSLEPLRKWASVTMPTLVMDGGKSPAFMHSGAQALTDTLPNAQHHHFPDQDHNVADDVLVPVLVEFFKG